MKTSLFISFLAIYYLSCSVLCAEVTIIGYEIPGLHQADGKGAYDKIIASAIVKSGVATLKIYPPARAKESFSTCNECCVSPANKDSQFYEYGKQYRQTDPMNVAKLYIFVNKGKKPLNHLEELKNKTVGIRLGMPYGKKIDEANLITYKVHELDKHIHLLNHGRIDVFLAWVPDMYKMFRKLDLTPYPHDISHPIAVHADRLVCKGVSTEFINIFNTMLKTLKDDGQLIDFLGENHIVE